MTPRQAFRCGAAIFVLALTFVGTLHHWNPSTLGSVWLLVFAIILLTRKKT